MAHKYNNHMNNSWYVQLISSSMCHKVFQEGNHFLCAWFDWLNILLLLVTLSAMLKSDMLINQLSTVTILRCAPDKKTVFHISKSDVWEWSICRQEEDATVHVQSECHHWILLLTGVLQVAPVTTDPILPSYSSSLQNLANRNMQNILGDYSLIRTSSWIISVNENHFTFCVILSVLNHCKLQESPASTE